MGHCFQTKYLARDIDVRAELEKHTNKLRARMSCSGATRWLPACYCKRPALGEVTEVARLLTDHSECAKIYCAAL